MLYQSPRNLAHRDRTIARLCDENRDGGYRSNLFEQRWNDLVSDGWRTNHIVPLSEAEMIVLADLVAAAVGSCDDVECDPVNTALDAFEAVRPSLRDDILEEA